ncbi:REI1 [[Candida] subhashii]|uniref:REI1 n=1 Tax=[Candida] subhashii TaxID=561895 RepID=A0A8J5QDK0_9ASCO|nr:REI1 [[Candida] subhashii]KAG7660733.1 REI1 [[Candida] subhashii]
MFTCTTCDLQFPTPEDQRTHMKGEWHRYNLKRRVAQLPPISEELFNSKVATLAESEEAVTDNKKGKGEKQLTKKEQRRREKEALLEKKRQILEQAKMAMLAKMKENGGVLLKPESKLEQKPQPEVEVEVEETTPEEKEPEAVEQPEESTEPKELTAEEEEEKLLADKLANKLVISPTTCLFAHPKYNHKFNTIEENMDHMFKQHGLYIPEQSYLVDAEGLLEYLAEKIGFGFCIACNYQGRTAEAAREHMQQKRHMRIPYETEDEKLEISKFYDFSSTYANVPKVAKKVVVVDGEQEREGDDEDWEDVSDEGEEDVDDSEEELDLPEQDAIYQDGHELILPSGTVLGHRSMARYYRQNLTPERVLSEGQGTVIAAETRHMLTLKDRQELATKKRVWAREKKREDVNDRRAAKFINQQKHYRDELLQ